MFIFISQSVNFHFWSEDQDGMSQDSSETSEAGHAYHLTTSNGQLKVTGVSALQLASDRHLQFTIVPASVVRTAFYNI